MYVERETEKEKERDNRREIQVGVHTQIPMYQSDEQQQSRCIEAMAAAQKEMTEQMLICIDFHIKTQKRNFPSYFSQKGTFP